MDARISAGELSGAVSMCGIVGLFLKDQALEPMLGELLSDMLITLSDRGPDSAGVAIYGRGGQNTKITLQSAEPLQEFGGLESELKAAGIDATVSIKSTHAVVETAADVG